MEHILSLSYGKDSLACLGAIDELGWPLDRIVHAEVWATDTIPADSPRYKALGNSVAIPCVEFVLWGLLAAAGKAEQR